MDGRIMKFARSDIIGKAASGAALMVCLFVVRLFAAESDGASAISAKLSAVPELQTTRHWANSRPLTLHELRGKYVLLDFWGYWCGPCLRHMPHLMALHEAFSDRGLTVIGVHDASVRSIAEMNDRLAPIKANLWMGHAINFPIVVDAPDTTATNAQATGSGATIRAYGITEFPTLLLIDPKGKLVGKFHAPSLEEEIA